MINDNEQIVHVYDVVHIQIGAARGRQGRACAPTVDHRQQIIDSDGVAAVDIAKASWLARVRQAVLIGIGGSSHKNILKINYAVSVAIGAWTWIDAQERSEIV